MYVPAAGAGRDLLLVLLVWTLGLAASALYVGLAFFPLAALGAVAVVVKSPRARVAAYAIVFVGASLAYAVPVLPVEEAALVARNHVPPGETILIEGLYGQYYYPFLADYRLVDVRQQTGEEDWFIWIDEVAGEPYGGEGWTRVAQLESRHDLGPGTVVSLWLEDTLLGGRVKTPEQLGMGLYRRDAA